MTAVTEPITEPITTARAVSRHYGGTRAVDGVDLDVFEGDVLGVVGESGSGKSTLGRVLAQLEPATAGEVTVAGRNALALRGRERRAFRRHVQFVFQDPYSALNPRRTIGQSLEEPLLNHRMGNRRERAGRVLALMDACGLRAELADRYPNELSGGQRQRVGIARALVLRPRVLVLDEPLSALDVSVQAQIVNLLKELREEFALTYVFITHDLGIVEYLCNRVAVMYRGRIVETADTGTAFAGPRHPYTTALLSAVPVADPERERRREPILLAGEAADAWDGRGCRFAARCPVARDDCRTAEPPVVETAPGQLVACHYPGSLKLP
nr:dipeptide ABC transporter ATP-binding protein [Dactylosporangium thailandense]